MTDAAPVPSPRPAIILAVIAIIGAILVGFAIRADAAFQIQEQRDLNWLSHQHTPLGNALALAVNYGLGVWGAIIITTVLAVVIGVVQRSAAESLRFALVVAFSWGAVQLVKFVVQRPRPSAADYYASIIKEPASWSYPSGHTAFAVALGLAILTVLVRAHASRGWVRAAAWFTVVLALVTAWSRMYLGVHHLSDVFASMLLVPCVALAVFRVEQWLIARRSSPEHAEVHPLPAR